MKISILRYNLMLVCLLLISLSEVFAQQKAKVNLFRDRLVTLSDGVRLATDIYKPQPRKKYPVILLRTPYNKDQYRKVATKLAKAGFAIVIQDVRGRWKSGGDFRGWIDEKRDGLETLDWLVKQNWCNGNIGMWGNSYSGFSAVTMAPSCHPNLKAIFNTSGPGDLYQTIFPGGVFHQMALLPWTLAFTDGKLPPSFSGLFRDLPKIFKTRPLAKVPANRGYQGSFWSYILNHQKADMHWSLAGIDRSYARVDVPIFHLTGWNDFIVNAAIHNYEQIQQHQKPGNTKNFQKLMIGPWHHDQQGTSRTKAGDYDFGKDGGLVQWGLSS